MKQKIIVKNTFKLLKLQILNSKYKDNYCHKKRSNLVDKFINLIPTYIFSKFNLQLYFMHRSKNLYSIKIIILNRIEKKLIALN